MSYFTVIRKISVLGCLLIALGAGAAERAPQPGDYGFNWLDTESHCSKLTPEEVSSFSSCEAQENTFGIDISSHACSVSEDVEFIVYRTAEQCQQALETMQSNAP